MAKVQRGKNWKTGEQFQIAPRFYKLLETEEAEANSADTVEKATCTEERS